MEQSELWRNLTGTVSVLGLTISTMGFNSTPLICSFDNALMGNYKMVDQKGYNSTRDMAYEGLNNVYIERHKNKLDLEAEALFGKMREATAEESASVNNYIRGISKNTGVDFFDLC